MLSSHTSVVLRELVVTSQDDQTLAASPSVTCSELDWQFRPFQHYVELPQCWDKVRPVFTLYRGTDSCRMDPPAISDIRQSTETCVELLLGGTVSQMVVVVHGFRASGEEWQVCPIHCTGHSLYCTVHSLYCTVHLLYCTVLYCTLWQVSLTSALVTEPSRVVIVTDWGHGAGTNIFHYWQAAANTRCAGVTYTLYCTVLYCTILYTPGTWV